MGGTTGENMSLSVTERKKIVDEWVRAAKITSLHVMVQVGGAPLPDVVTLVRVLYGKLRLIVINNNLKV